MNAVLSVGLALKVVTLRAHWRGRRPQPGDFMRSVAPRARAAYRIISVKPSRSRAYPLRLRCERVTLASIPDDATVFSWLADRPVRKRTPLRSPLL